MVVVAVQADAVQPLVRDQEFNPLLPLAEELPVGIRGGARQGRGILAHVVPGARQARSATRSSQWILTITPGTGIPVFASTTCPTTVGRSLVKQRVSRHASEPTANRIGFERMQRHLVVVVRSTEFRFIRIAGGCSRRMVGTIGMTDQNRELRPGFDPR